MKLRGPEPPAALSLALGACRRHLIAAAVFSALLNLLYLTPTLYMLQVYDRVVPTRGAWTLLLLSLVAVFAVATLALLDLARARLLVRASLRLDRMLSPQILQAALRSAAGGRDATGKQALREFDTFRQTLTGVGILALFDAPWTPIYILVVSLISPWLGALGLIGGLGLLLVAWRNEVKTGAPLQDANRAANAAYSSLEYSNTSAEVIRALGMNTAMVRRHMDERRRWSGLIAKASFAAGGYVTLTRFLRLSLQSAALGLGAFLAIQDQISAGAIFAASILVARALAPIEQVIGAWKSMVQARGAYGALVELFHQAGEQPALMELPPILGDIKVEALTVLAPGRETPIIDAMSFSVGRGQIVGVIGPSGAGKSTLARILSGAATPDRGAIRLDGADMRDWDSERLARYIGYLPQDPTLFAGAIRDNIARFRTGDIPDSELDAMVVQAAERCGAHEMILKLPGGYNTELGFGGRGLSAGQAQRIALARALFAAPSVLVLDEPNAHLDTEGEARLVQTLLQLRAEGRTVLIVAHRTGILAALDKLMLIRDGRIDLYGPRDEVLRKLSSAPPALPSKPAPAPAAAVTRTRRAAPDEQLRTP